MRRLSIGSQELHLSDLTKSTFFRHEVWQVFLIFEKNRHKFAIFVAIIARTQPKFVGISPTIQKMLPNALNLKKIAKIWPKVRFELDKKLDKKIDKKNR